MNRKEAIRSAQQLRGHIFTTDELWEDDENCILTDSLGVLIWGNGEIIDNIEELPLDGWYDATDIEESIEPDDWLSHTGSYRQEDVLWDENDRQDF